MFERIILIVLDGVGIGALPDAGLYHDQDAATLQHVAESCGGLNLPHLQSLGLGNVAAISGISPVPDPAAWFGKMAEVSPGKDSVTGHWELAGVTLEEPFATYCNGFPAEIIQEFAAVAGCQPLGNIAASGTEILKQLGEEHLRTRRPIVYTSTDSVFQIAAHEDILPPQELYQLCRQAESLLAPYRICRVIARPFRGDTAETFYRTSGRHDFPRTPPHASVLDALLAVGQSTCSVGKVYDLFAGQGLAQSYPTISNQDGMNKTLEAIEAISSGLIFVNLVDFDMLYGHRLDAAGFAKALSEFDDWLPVLFGRLNERDLLLITADHGCDPTTAGTDHTREYVPLLAYSSAFNRCGSLGIRSSFADIAATIADNYQAASCSGESFLDALV